LASYPAFKIQSVYLGLKTRPQNKHVNASASGRTNTRNATTEPAPTTQLDSDDTKDEAGGTTAADGTGTEDDIDANPAGTSRRWEDKKNEDTELGSIKKYSEKIAYCKFDYNLQPRWEDMEITKPGNTKLGSIKEDGETSQAPGIEQQKPPKNRAGISKKKAKIEGKGPSNSRRKAFITLSYIVIAYVVCWTPFQFVFDVSLAKPEAISGDLYTAMFWLAYINSGLNPFMYAFSSADFRGAAVRMIKCRFCKP